MTYLLLLFLGLATPLAAAAGEFDPLLEPGAAGSIEQPGRDTRGVLRARHQAVLASEQAGRITAMPFAEGESFAKDDVLVRFDCSGYQAQRDAAAAAVRAASEELNNKQQLAALKSVGRFEVALAEARHAQARAEASGAPLLEIVDNRSLEIHLLVPSRWLGQLQPGQPFSFIPDETGKPLAATVKRLGARIDEGSQTLLLIGTLPADAQGLLAGMSGTARFADQP